MLKFTTINHQAKMHLQLNFIEYSVADSIYQLSTNPKGKNAGWCSASKQYLSEFIGVSREHVSRVIAKLVELNLVEKKSDKSKLLRTTSKWYEAVISEEKSVIKDHTTESKCDNLSHPSVTKDHINCDKLSHPSNIYNNYNDIDSSIYVEKLNEASKNLQTEMEQDRLQLELICMQQRMEMPEVIRLVVPWAKENATTTFQSTNHKRNSFKKFVQNSGLKVSHKNSQPVGPSRPMLKAGERRQVG